MSRLDPTDESILVSLARTLIDQHRARVIVPPQQDDEGFWFGGGNLVQAPDGSLRLVGRYRNAGDSRVGVASGVRGLELAIFRADGPEAGFEKIASFSKADLNLPGREVLSIEGAALKIAADGDVELFVSTEKGGIPYPPGLEAYLKPGTGVWTVEHLAAESVDALGGAPIRTLLESRDPRFLHIKDPLLYRREDGQWMLFFCTHPYGWSSSNSGCALLSEGRVVAGSESFDFFPRGFTWDVAMARTTCVVDVPRVGRFRDRRVTLLFYDGGESLRNLDEHAAAVRRPRGYSCEELGGLAYAVDGDFSQVHRLSQLAPLFVSPFGTGCSRYVDVLATDAGLIATWQQSQSDLSQPLVMHFVPQDEVTRVLG